MTSESCPEATRTRRRVPGRPPPLPDPNAARLFWLLGAPARLRLLRVIRGKGEVCVGDLPPAGQVGDRDLPEPAPYPLARISHQGSCAGLSSVA